MWIARAAADMVNASMAQDRLCATAQLVMKGKHVILRLMSVFLQIACMVPALIYWDHIDANAYPVGEVKTAIPFIVTAIHSIHAKTEGHALAV